jgi:hypothetical protein
VAHVNYDTRGRRCQLWHPGWTFSLRSPAGAPSTSPGEPALSTGYAGSPSVTGRNLPGKSAGTPAGEADQRFKAGEAHDAEVGE